MACDADLLQFISGNARMTADYKSGFAFSGSYELRNNFLQMELDLTMQRSF